MFIFDASPQPFDKDIVDGPALSVHAELYAMLRGRLDLLHLTGHWDRSMLTVWINFENMSKPKREYTTEFKQKAVELSYARGNAAEVCRELGLKPSTLGRWRREAKKYWENSFPGKGNPKLTDEQREIAELKKKLRDVEIELDILKKAIAIFS